MSDELSQEELEAIAEDVQQTILAKVAEAVIEIGEEKLSQALGGGLSTWKLAFAVSNAYIAKFKEMSEHFKLDRADVYKSQLVRNCMIEGIAGLQLAQTLMRKEGGAFGGLFGGGETNYTLADYQTHMTQCYIRMIEAEAHFNSGLDLYSEKLKAEKKEAEKE